MAQFWGSLAIEESLRTVSTQLSSFKLNIKPEEYKRRKKANILHVDEVI